MKLVNFTIIIFLLIPLANVSGQVRLSVSGFSTTTSVTDFTNAVAVINAPVVEVNETVSFMFYDGRFIDDRKLLLTSSEFTLLSGISRVNLSEYLNDAKISSSQRSNQYITIAIINSNTRITKGFATISAVQSSNNNSKSKSLLNLEGSTSMSSTISNGSLDTFNLLNSNNLELHTKASVGGVPLYIDALATDYIDPFDNGRNASYFTINFLAEEWKETQKAKISAQVNEEANKFNPISKANKLAASKHDYLEKVFNTESFTQDFDELKTSYSDMVDSLGSFDIMTQLIKEKDSEILDLLKKELISSEKAKVIRDSLDNVNASVERLKKYEELSTIKDSCASIRKSIDKKLNAISKYKESIYNTPSEINKRLRESKTATQLATILNHLDIFKVGIINPRFSKYSLATSQNKGAHVAINLGYLSIETFYARSLSRGLTLGNTLMSNRDNYIGGKFKIQYNELLSNSVFYITGIENYSTNINSQIGYSLEYENINKKLQFETIWAQGETIGDKNNENLASLFSNAALDLTYSQQGNLFKYNWRMNLKFLGENFSDFNNPFLFNNNLSANSSISFSFIKDLKSSLNANFQEGNIQSNTSALNRRVSIGGSNTFVKQNWPIITHSFQYGVMDIQGNKVKNQLQNISSQYNYEVLNRNISTSFMFSWSDNTASLDSLNTTFRMLSFTNTLDVSEKLAINLIGDYSQSYGDAIDNSDLISLELSPSIKISNFNFNIGAKYIYEELDQRLGWLFRVNYSNGSNINLNLDMDNSIFERYINETGEIRDNFYERYSASLNYKF